MKTAEPLTLIPVQIQNPPPGLITTPSQIWLAIELADMRRGIYGLSAHVQYALGKWALTLHQYKLRYVLRLRVIIGKDFKQNYFDNWQWLPKVCPRMSNEV